MGKTQLALEYIYRHAGDYSLVWWVRSEEQAILASDFADLATPLELPQAEFQEQRLKINAVRQRLGQIFNWLLVFDNAIRPEDLMSYLPQGSSGHVIITVKASPTSFWGWQSPTIFCSLYYTPHKNGAVLNFEY